MPLFTSLLRPHDECKPRALAGCESIPLWLYGIQPCNTSTFWKKKDSSGCCMYQLSGTSKWLLPQWSTAQNLQNFWQATRFLCHPVPLSIGAVGNVMSICVQRLTITKTVRSCEGLWRIHYLPSQPNCIPPSSARHSMRSMQFVYRSQIFSSGESQFTQNGDIRVSLWIEENSTMAGHWVWLSHNLQSEHIELVKKMPWRYWSYSVILFTILLEVGNTTRVSLQDGAPQLQVGLWTIITPINYG